MGFNLAIGEAVIEVYESCNIVVEGKSLDNAPAFGEPTDKQNQRWPSYIQWAEFSRALDIVDLFSGTRDEIKYKGEYLYPLITEHPGAMPITKYHLQFVKEKYEEYKLKNPTHFPEYPKLKESVPEPGNIAHSHGLFREEDYVDDPTCDGMMCRAEWLIFWMDWALNNCKIPVFYNS